MTTNNLSGKNIVIIGGTAGIGLVSLVPMCGPQEEPKHI
jgi:hypothetical protein